MIEDFGGKYVARKWAKLNFEAKCESLRHLLWGRWVYPIEFCLTLHGLWLTSDVIDDDETFFDWLNDHVTVNGGFDY